MGPRDNSPPGRFHAGAARSRSRGRAAALYNGRASGGSFSSSRDAAPPPPPPPQGCSYGFSGYATASYGVAAPFTGYSGQPRGDYAEQKPEAYRAFLRYVKMNPNGAQIALADKMCQNHHVADLLQCVEAWFRREVGSPSQARPWRIDCFDLARNGLSDSSVVKIVEWLMRHSVRVKHLFMESNALTGAALTTLTEYIWNCPEAIDELDFGDNRIRIDSIDRQDDPVSALLRCIYNHSAYPRKTRRGMDTKVVPMILRLENNYISHGRELLDRIRSKGGDQSVKLCSTADSVECKGGEFLVVFIPDIVSQKPGTLFAALQGRRSIEAPPGVFVSQAEPAAQPFAAAEVTAADDVESASESSEGAESSERPPVAEEEAEADYALAEEDEAPIVDNATKKNKKKHKQKTRTTCIDGAENKDAGCTAAPTRLKAIDQSAVHDALAAVDALDTRTGVSDDMVQERGRVQAPQERSEPDSESPSVGQEGDAPGQVQATASALAQSAKPKSAPKAKAIAPERTTALLGDLQEGDRFTGTIASLQDPYAYVDIGAEAHGLLHVSDTLVSAEHIKDAFRVGDSVRVEISNVNQKRRKVRLKQLAEPAGERKRAKVDHRTVTPERPARTQPTAVLLAGAGGAEKPVKGKVRIRVKRRRDGADRPRRRQGTAGGKELTEEDHTFNAAMDLIDDGLGEEEQFFLQQDVKAKLRKIVDQEEDEAVGELAELVVVLLLARKGAVAVRLELEGFLQQRTQEFLNWLTEHLRGPWLRARRRRAGATPKAAPKRR